MAQEINISVTGHAGVGKSTIVEIIRQALENYEFSSITVSATEDNYDSSKFEESVKFLNKTGVTKINIGTHQTMRNSHTD